MTLMNRVAERYTHLVENTEVPPLRALGLHELVPVGCVVSFVLPDSKQTGNIGLSWLTVCQNPCG